jgi:hypothetical protein
VCLRRRTEMRLRDFFEVIDIYNHYQLIVIMDEKKNTLEVNLRADKKLDFEDVFEYSFLTREIKKLKISDYAGIGNAVMIYLLEKEKE